MPSLMSSKSLNEIDLNKKLMCHYLDYYHINIIFNKLPRLYDCTENCILWNLYSYITFSIMNFFLEWCFFGYQVRTLVLRFLEPRAFKHKIRPIYSPLLWLYKKGKSY